ncbi:hypothetical protein [Nocardia paucivorans]|uniref:hypothetical protein n=1 Tax=Nocardia paucivorans TaxID=114259 RepID=UPI0002E7B7E3|nr:hypothetical protein [Nocardia paucivorans]
MLPSEAHAHPEWKRTGHRHFPVAAEVDGNWWVLRLNSFPAHDMWTLFVDGVARYDITDTPPTWGRPLTEPAPALDPCTVHAVLAPIAHLTAYGSEVGKPCDDPFCCG